jgi:hypothetical protein
VLPCRVLCTGWLASYTDQIDASLARLAVAHTPDTLDNSVAAHSADALDTPGTPDTAQPTSERALQASAQDNPSTESTTPAGAPGAGALTVPQNEASPADQELRLQRLAHGRSLYRLRKAVMGEQAADVVAVTIPVDFEVGAWTGGVMPLEIIPVRNSFCNFVP